MSKARKFYEEKIKDAEDKIKKLNSEISKISILRLAIVLIGIGVAYKLYTSLGFVPSAIGVIVTLGIFMAVAVVHGNKINEKDILSTIIEINSMGLKRLDGGYREFEDKGKEFIEEEDHFCEDLDVFGQNSLFQMINTTRNISVRKKLAEILSVGTLPTKEKIIEKQKAIKELGDKVEWRQKLYINSTFKKKHEDIEGLVEWGKEKSSEKSKVIIACVFIAITMISIFMVIAKIIPISMLILNFIVNFMVIKVLTKNSESSIHLFNSIKNSVKAYSNILALIEDEEFESDYLKDLKSKLNNTQSNSCKKEMQKLSNLLEWVGDSSGNAYFFVLNIVIFADVFILYNLNKWREANGDKIEGWLEVMGEFDALSSIANISFDHEDWCYPEISNNKEVEGKEISHPLIGERAVANDFVLKNPKQIVLITGSNMSGKSTFLRTIGINLILSYIGAPVSAKSFKCGIMNIYTCMRTKDNLEESISSFYAEILRIKLVIEACNRGEDVFFLLDEIFKGTNSKDRHTGATVLVKQLAQKGAIGLLSTHDLELCDLENTMKELDNYNFREYYEDNKIKFDYKLRQGKSTTQNAVYLMKLAGIEI